MSRNLVSRIVVAAIFGPAIIWIAYQGGWWLYGMLFVFVTIGSGEYLIAENVRPGTNAFWFVLVSVVVLYTTLTGLSMPVIDSLRLLTGGSHTAAAAVVIAAFYLLSAMAFAIGKTPPDQLFRRHSRMLWGFVYLGVTYPLVYLVGNGVRGLHGGDSLLFLFGILWLGDTAAMGIGKALGRHKLAPTVSPNKTVEGFLGGITGALLIGLIMYVWKFSALGLVHVMIVAAGCSVFGQLGDLVESMWKRSIGIKDSSAIIPGHGGVLDRFDSLLFAAPFMYFYFSVIVP